MPHFGQTLANKFTEKCLSIIEALLNIPFKRSEIFIYHARQGTKLVDTFYTYSLCEMSLRKHGVTENVHKNVLIRYGDVTNQSGVVVIIL